MSDKSTVRSAFRWSAAGTAATELIGLILLVILARLLTPEDYGIAAIVAAMLAIGRIVTEVGFDRALVQRQSINPDDETSVCYANLCLGLITGSVLFLAAPALATFYDEPRLTPMLQAVALQPPLMSLGLLQIALAERALDFRSRAIAEIAANAASGIIAVTMALSGYGAWSLIGQTMAFALLRAGLLNLLRPWRPRGHFSFASLACMWGFSWRLFLSKLAHILLTQIHTLALGRLLGLVEVGLLNRGRNLQTPLTSALSTIIGRVSFASFARMQDDPKRMHAAFRRVLRVQGGAVAAMMCGLAAVAVPLVEVTLSDRWITVAPIVQGFALFGFFFSLSGLYQALAQALGRTDLHLYANLVHHGLAMSTLLLTWRVGILAVVLGLGAAAAVGFLFWAWIARRLIVYHWRDQFTDLAPQILAGALCGSAAHVVVKLLDAPAPVVLTLACLSGAAAWAAPIMLIHLPAFTDLRNEALRMLSRKRQHLPADD